jgi:hypothetical protein
MIIHLQNSDTKEFVDRDGRWTSDRASAREFEAGHEALLFSLAHGLYHAQVVYEFHDPQMNFAMRITDGHIGILPQGMTDRPSAPDPRLC